MEIMDIMDTYTPTECFLIFFPDGIQIIKIQPENWCVWNESGVELNYREMKYFFYL